MNYKPMIVFMLIFMYVPATGASELNRAEYIMGSLFTLTLDTSFDGPKNNEIADHTFAILRTYDHALSDYDKNSELSYVQSQAKKTPLLLSNTLCQALSSSDYYHQITQGAFDITVRPLVEAWGFKDHNFRVLQNKEIHNLLTSVGHHYLQRQDCHLFISNAKTQLDFGAIGKGLAIDAVVAYLKQERVPAAVIDGGSSSQYFLGAPQHSPRGWPVALRGKEETIVWLKNKAIASSGDDQQFFEMNGQHYSHIIDPRTGKPVKYRGSVTIIADSATTADAMSTALMVLGAGSDRLFSEQLNLKIIRQHD